jgi:hypothetical protein
MVSRYFSDLVRRDRWLQFSIASTLLAWTLTAGLLTLLVGPVDSPPTPRGSPVSLMVGGLIVAPLLENLLVVVALLLLRNRFSDRLSVGIMTAIAFAFHGVFASWMAIAALALFSTMGLSYVAWHPSRPRLAFFILFFQHALFNLPATAMVASDVWLSR